MSSDLDTIEEFIESQRVFWAKKLSDMHDHQEERKKELNEFELAIAKSRSALDTDKIKFDKEKEKFNELVEKKVSETIEKKVAQLEEAKTTITASIEASAKELNEDIERYNDTLKRVELETDDPIITLDVGGKIFKSRLSVLTKFPGSYFPLCFAANSEKRMNLIKFISLTDHMCYLNQFCNIYELEN